MVFVSTCKETETYGQGKKISKDRFKTKHGVNLFYYDSTSVNDEFSNYGLVEIKEIKESSQTLLAIICRKPS
tara:strand:+ start:88 stop:303 length:216 start_codon:yes stop_codon:yes gene_type:complete